MPPARTPPPPPESNTARTARALGRGVRATAAGAGRTSRFFVRNWRLFRFRGGEGNAGMMGLLDLHAISCAGDTLVAIGLAGTIFFKVPVDSARGQVALYLLVTMVPFALLAPVIGPMLDRFRHGRRFALAITMLGRAVFAWIIADHIAGIGLYPAVCVILVLSRTYGLARSAAVPRLLPSGLGLSQAGARAAVFGTVAGALVVPIGALAFTIGPQWPLRVASLIFLLGVLSSFNLPPRADSDAPEVVPKLFRPFKEQVADGMKILSGRLVVATLSSSVVFRALYGFLLVFLAFTIRKYGQPTSLLGIPFRQTGAVALVGGSLGLGTFLATLMGTGWRVRRPAAIQAIGLCLVVATGVIATAHFSLGALMLLCLTMAIASGLSKLCVDATIQERVPDRVRASAFAHSETLLMLAWVAGAALGLIPMPGQIGVGIAIAGVTLAAIRALLLMFRLRGERLRGTFPTGLPDDEYAGRYLDGAVAEAPTQRRSAPQKALPRGSGRSDPPAGPRGQTNPSQASPSQSNPSQAVATTQTATPPPAATQTDSVPGFHVFRPTPPDDGVSDPRSGA